MLIIMIRKVKENGRKVVRHIWERRLEYFVVVFLVAASVGAYFSFLGGELAKADVTSVSVTIAATDYGYRYETNSVSGSFVSTGNPVQDTAVGIFIGEASYINSMVPDGDLVTVASF